MNMLKKGEAVKKRLLFEIRTIEWQIETRGLLDRAYQHDYYQLAWITQGAGHYCIDMQSYPLSDNTLVFLPPGKMHRIRSGRDTKGFMISFDPDMVQLPDIIDRFSRLAALSLADPLAEGRLMSVVKDMCREFDEQPMLRREVVSGLLNIFLMYLQLMSAPVQRDPICSTKVRLFNTFYMKLEKDFLTKRSVAEYANELSITPSYLTEVTKKVTGYSASHHIQQRMVLEAKRLAMYSDANMKLIAYKLGFTDLSYFSKFFKHGTGMNFSEFRSRQLVVSPKAEMRST